MAREILKKLVMSLGWKTKGIKAPPFVEYGRDAITSYREKECKKRGCAYKRNIGASPEHLQKQKVFLRKKLNILYPHETKLLTARKSKTLVKRILEQNKGVRCYGSRACK